MTKTGQNVHENEYTYIDMTKCWSSSEVFNDKICIKSFRFFGTDIGKVTLVSKWFLLFNFLRKKTKNARQNEYTHFGAPKCWSNS